MTTQGTPTAQLVDPVRTADADWIPTGPGKSFRPLRFDDGGWWELMRLEPGAVVGLHRHTGEVHAFNIAGTRQILGTDEIISSGDYVYEPAGNVDTWQAVGSEPCIVHIKVLGTVEYLDDTGHVVGRADSASQSATHGFRGGCVSQKVGMSPPARPTGSWTGLSFTAHEEERSPSVDSDHSSTTWLSGPDVGPLPPPAAPRV